MLTTMSWHSDMPNDADCFQELTDDTFEAIGSDARAIQNIIQQNVLTKVI